MYCFLPFGIMLIANIILVLQIIPSKTLSSLNQEERSSKRRSMSISILVLTTLFMILGLPQTLANAFYLPVLYSSSEGILLLSGGELTEGRREMKEQGKWEFFIALLGG